MRHSAKGNAYLFMAAIVWGFSLAAQKEGLKYIDPLFFTAIRCLLGGLVMIPVVCMRMRAIRRENEAMEVGDKDEGGAVNTGKPEIAAVIKCALCCGLLIGTTILLQQIGLPYTSVGKAGFITALYIFITPILGLFMGKKTTRNLWTGVIIGLAGLYLLCLFGGIEAITFGDLMMFIAAFLCAFHIHAIDHFVKKVDPALLTCSQFIVAGLPGLISAFLMADITWDALRSALFPVVYAGVIACAVGYTFQTIGQKLTNPNLACLIMAMETVFTLFSGWIFFGEVLAVHEYIGCGLMFAAIVVSQLPDDVLSVGMVKTVPEAKENIDMQGK